MERFSKADDDEDEGFEDVSSIKRSISSSKLLMNAEVDGAIEDESKIE